MTAPARLQALERGLNGMARKVLDAVPISEAWTAQVILSEMMRANGTAPAFDVMQGCLSHLTEIGLVKHAAGLYQRSAPRARLKVASQALDESPAQDGVNIDIVHAKQPAPPALDRLAAIGANLRGLSQALAKLADEIDDAALSADEQIKVAGAESDKLRQLRELLAGLK